MPGLTLVRVHEPDAVREIIQQAHHIAFQEANEGASYDLVFNKAVDLLAARIPLPPAASLDLSGLTLGPRV